MALFSHVFTANNYEPTVKRIQHAFADIIEKIIIETKLLRFCLADGKAFLCNITFSYSKTMVLHNTNLSLKLIR